MKALLVLGLLVTCCWGCGDDTKPAADAGPNFPAWTKQRPSAEVAIGAHRGLVPSRGIIHLHSPLSHDACDGQGYDEATGTIDESCLSDLRSALCINRIDFAALTDHDNFMAHEDFAKTYLQRDNDEFFRNGAGEAVASIMNCDNGQQVMWSVGGENSLMPIMLNRHPEGSIADRQRIYNGNDEASAQAYRDLGGLAFIAHTESKSLELLRSLKIDGLEIYNLHANLDPTIRSEYLGLNGPAAIHQVLKFADAEDTGPEPDLAMLAFLEPATLALSRWDKLLGEGLRITGTAGTDAHQNALPLIFRDGERGDSYRRMISWFSNIALVSKKGDPTLLQEALKAGRSYVAFEFMGTPAGFDVRATSAGKATVELGGEVSESDSYVMEVTVPSVYALDERLQAPTIRVSILRVDASGTTEVAAGNSGTVSAPLDAVGAYRVEVYSTPRHLIPYLRTLSPEYAQKELPWLYANPIYVTAASQ